MSTTAQPIFLIGFMAAGKTTLGQALAVATGRPFVDTDLLIEQDCGMSVRQIFETQGEDAFRRLETETLRAISSRADAPIVACGGGLPCRSENMDMMLAAGDVVWLQAPEDVLLRRIILGGDSRPLTLGKSRDELREYIARTIVQRTPAYSRANATFDSSRLESQAQIDAAVAAFTSRFFNGR